MDFDENEVNKEIKWLPKDEMIMLMRFRLLSDKQKVDLILELDKTLEEQYGEEGRKIFDSIFG